MLSTAASPESFSDFHTASGADQLVVDYFKGTGTSGCIRVMPTQAGIPGIQNGSDVTLQMVFDGGDGKLYQVSREKRCSFLGGEKLDVLTWIAVVHGRDAR